MIGEILVGDRSIVRMEDNGIYTAVDPKWEAIADLLNVTESPTECHEPGDSGRPFGVAALFRACDYFKSKGASVSLANPIQDPKPGLVY